MKFSPAFRRSHDYGKASSRVPLLGSYRRSDTTAHDGTVTEHGDGFMLTSIDPQDPRATKGLVL